MRYTMELIMKGTMGTADISRTPRLQSLLIETLAELIHLDRACIRPREMPTGVLVCTPESFDVVDEKNYFMTGNIGTVARDVAVEQWRIARDAMRESGRHIEEIAAVHGVEDMVFAANAALTCKELGGRKGAIMSRMYHESRQRETPHYAARLNELGYDIIELSDTPGRYFEGAGDAVWHPGMMLLYGGYGHRSTKDAYSEISERLDIPVIALELVSDEFYHLDTCMCVLDAETVLYCPEAFTSEGQAMIEYMFPRRITITKDQGRDYMTGNCFSIGNGNVVLQKGDTTTVHNLIAAGFLPIEVDLSEYIKSGGNTTCLKLDLYA